MVFIYSLARSRMNAIAIDIASWDAGVVRFHVLQMPKVGFKLVKLVKFEIQCPSVDQKFYLL